MCQVKGHLKVSDHFSCEQHDLKHRHLICEAALIPVNLLDGTWASSPEDQEEFFSPSSPISLSVVAPSPWCTG
jgi:hypothetical protein